MRGRWKTGKKWRKRRRGTRAGLAEASKRMRNRMFQALLSHREIRSGNCAQKPIETATIEVHQNQAWTDQSQLNIRTCETTSRSIHTSISWGWKLRQVKTNCRCQMKAMFPLAARAEIYISSHTRARCSDRPPPLLMGLGIKLIKLVKVQTST